MKKFLFFILISFVSSATMAAQAKVDSGIFVVHNKTNKTVTVGVGNFFPTTYVIAPGSKKMVAVSSDNQNIQIEDVK